MLDITYMGVWVCGSVRACVGGWVGAWVRACMHACVRVCVDASVRVCVCACVCMCACMHIYASMYKVPLRDAGKVNSRGRRKANRQTPVKRINISPPITMVLRVLT